MRSYQFDDRKSTPLSFFPLTAQNPFFHFCNQLAQIFWITFENLIKLCEFAGSEEHFCQTEFEIIVI